VRWCRGRCAPQLNPPHFAARLKKAARRSSRRCTRACERPFRIRGPPTSHNSFLDCESVAWYMQPMATTAANGTMASRCVLFFSQTAPRSNRKALCVFEIGRRNKAGVAKNCQNHLQNPKRKRASSSSSGSDSDSAPIQRQQRAAQGKKMTQQSKKALFIIKNPLFF
jgi:hypothetical protein